MKHNDRDIPNWIYQKIKALDEYLNSKNVILHDYQLRKLEIYACKIIEWNRRTNLISKRDIDRIVEKHFAESLLILVLIDFPIGCKILDLGSGAGFPGMPIKIARPDFNITFLDSKRIRTLFLRDVVSDLELQKTNVVCDRAESFPKQHDDQYTFDFVIARAVAKLKLLWEWSQPLLKKYGQLVAFKGGSINNELSELKEEFKQVKIEIHELPNEMSLHFHDLKLIIVSERYNEY